MSFGAWSAQASTYPAQPLGVLPDSLPFDRLAAVVGLEQVAVDHPKA
jgi:hypothetical protein